MELKKIVLSGFVIIILLNLQLCFSQTYRAGFDVVDQWAWSQDRWSRNINTRNELQASEPRVLHAYLTMFRATKDKHYLDKFLIHVKRVQERRDDNVLNVPYSEINNPSTCTTTNWNQLPNNTSVYAWSTEHDEQNCQYWIPRVLHSGNITYPMAEFVYFMKTDPDFMALINETLPPEAQSVAGYSLSTYGGFSDWLRERVKQTIQYHEADWCSNIGKYERMQQQLQLQGQTVTRGCASTEPDALNMQCAMGRTLIMMYMISQEDGSPNATYLNHIDQIAYWLTQELRHPQGTNPATGGFYYWYNDWQGQFVEDGGHGWIIMEFADLCYRYHSELGSYLFTLNDMQLFGNTVALKLAGNPLQFHLGTNGSDYGTYYNSNDAVPNYINAGQYAFMTPYNPYIYQIISDFFSDQAIYHVSNVYLDYGPHSMVALADLALNEHLFNPVAVLHNSNPLTVLAWAGACTGDFDGDGSNEFAATADGITKTYSVDQVNTISQTATLSNFNCTGLASDEFESSLPGNEIIAITYNTANVMKKSGAALSTLASVTINNGTASLIGVVAGNFTSVSNGNEILLMDYVNSSLKLYQYNGGVFTSIPLTNSTSLFQQACMAKGNFDGTNSNEIVILDVNSGALKIYSIQSTSANGLTGDLTLIYQSTVSNISYNDAITAGDMDGDGIDEIIVYKNNDGQFLIFKIVNGTLVNHDSEYFPVNQQNKIMCTGRLGPNPAKDALVTFRNYDDQITIFNLDGLCPGLNLNNQTIDDAYSIDEHPTGWGTPDNNYPIDYHVNNTLIAGNNFTISSPSVVEMTAGNEIIFTDGFTASEGSELYAYITPALACDNPVFHKPVHNKNRPAPAQPLMVSERMKPEKNNNIIIAPNPNNGTFQITVTRNNNVVGVKEVKVFDLNGRMIWESNESTGTTCNVDISSYSQGIYYVRSMNSFGEVDMKKLIKF